MIYPSPNVLLSALLIFVVRVFSISLGTVRILLMGRVHRGVVFLLATFEAFAFALTFGQVASDLNNVWNLLAYSLGFASGTIVGMMIEGRVGAGFITLTIISTKKSRQISEKLREEGFGATYIKGEGSSGTVGIVRAVLRRRKHADVFALILGVDPKAFVTVEETRSVAHGFLEPRP